jgi:membrane-bound ClpP family serine protease
MIPLSSAGLLVVAAILFVAAIAFLAGELVVPSHGLLAIICIVFALLGVVACYMAAPALGIISGIVMLVAAPFAFYAAVRIYPSTPMGKRVMLKQPSVASGDAESEKLAVLVGKRGVATTPLRPVGACEIDGRRIECVSEATVIESGTPIEVTRVIGMRVIVRAVEGEKDERQKTKNESAV